MKGSITFVVTFVVPPREAHTSTFTTLSKDEHYEVEGQIRDTADSSCRWPATPLIRSGTNE